MRYPIREYVDNWVRSGASAVEELSTERDLGCSVFIQNGNARLSGACAAVQCSLGGSAWAGPGMTGSSPPTRETGVTNTATASWTNFTLVEISDDAEQLKNVFLYRTGDYVATTRRTYQWNTNPTLSIGKLPTSNGNNYGSSALLMIRCRLPKPFAFTFRSNSGSHIKVRCDWCLISFVPLFAGSLRHGRFP